MGGCVFNDVTHSLSQPSLKLVQGGFGNYSDVLDGFIDVSAGIEPDPQSFVVADLIPTGYITSLYGRAGSSKSFLAAVLAAHVVLGRSIFGKEVRQGPVVYLDGELEVDTFARRSWMIARGMGLERPPRRSRLPHSDGFAN